VTLWIVGLVLSLLAGASAWDTRRAGRASAPAMLALTAIGGGGLAAMAALALTDDAPMAALVAAVGAAPLLGGLLAGLRRARPAALSEAARAVPRPGQDHRPAAPAERRAA
jgi:hypothetical protein